MLCGLKDSLRRAVRGWNWAAYYPVLLPHFEVQDKGVRVLGKRFEPLSASVADALRLCDGTRTLKQVVRQAGVNPAEMIRQHDEGRLVIWTREVPPEPPADTLVEHVVVSPHPDDAVLSAFGAAVGDSWLFEEPGRSLVVDVFSRTGWSRFPELLRTPSEVQAVRVAEERLAARLLGARLELLGLPEAVLRGHSIDEVFSAPLDARDREAVDAVRDAAASLAARYPAARWYLPLGVGGHVDHRVVRDAALAALEAAGVPQNRLLFYEDLPYAAAEGVVPDFSTMVPGRKLERSGHDAGVWTAFNKREALRVYWSQLTWSQIRDVLRYVQRRGGSPLKEQYWQLAD